MVTTEIINSLKKMTNSERLEVIEIASQLIRKEINLQKDDETKSIDQNQNLDSKSSAEFKAWQRINSTTKDDEWIIVDDIGKEIDLEQVRQEFYQRGYKSKIST